MSGPSWGAPCEPGDFPETSRGGFENQPGNVPVDPEARDALGAELAVAGRMAEAIQNRGPADLAAIDRDDRALMLGLIADQIDVTKALALALEAAEARLSR